MTGLRRFAVPAFGAVAVVAACRKEAAPTSGSGSAAPAPAPLAAAIPAASAFHDDAWTLVIRPVGEYAAGQPARAEIELVPRGEYHTNDKYPYKWKAAESPGVRHAAPVVGKDAVDLTPARAALEVEFTPESAGQKSVSGQFSFSVCSEERCLVEKRDLVLQIAAK